MTESIVMSIKLHIYLFPNYSEHDEACGGGDKIKVSDLSHRKLDWRSTDNVLCKMRASFIFLRYLFKPVV